PGQVTPRRDTARSLAYSDARLKARPRGPPVAFLDYSREMALVAQHDGMTLGVARYSADPDRRSAAFAVAVSRLAWAWRWATVDDSTDRGHSNAATVNWSGRCCTRTSRCWVCADSLASAWRRSRTTRPCSVFENRWLPCSRVRLLSESPVC